MQDLTIILQTSPNLMELAKTLKNQTHSSAILNQRMISFMSSVSCLFESVNVLNDDAEEHHKRLLDTFSLWGFKLLHVDGDGNYCFLPLLVVSSVKIKTSLPEIQPVQSSES